jgi:hypothetical protein
MATKANVVINDGTSDRTFSPVTQSGNVLTLADSSSATSAGRPLLTLGFDPRSQRRKTDHVSVKLAIPFEETVDSQVIVEHTVRGTISAVIPEALPDAQRTEFAELMGAAATNALIKAYFEDLDPML